MAALLSSLLAFIFETAVLRVLAFAAIWWFTTGLIPVIVGEINGLAGDPLSLVPDWGWYWLDASGFDITLNAILSAYLVRFIIRRLPK